MKDRSDSPAAGGNHCYVNRELSWLQFNKRVLEEAEDPANPLCERMNSPRFFKAI